MSSVADRTDIASTRSNGYGGHSMVLPLKRVIVRRPTVSATGEEWRALGYVHPVDQSRADEEHQAFRSLIAAHGVDVIEAGPDAPGELDAIFPFDPSIMTNKGAVLLRPGKKLRLNEVDFAEATYGRLGIPILGEIQSPGTVEGGDTMWLDEETLAVGRGYRTNAEGIRQLGEILGSIGVKVLSFDLPHFNGPAECLHLLSLISPVSTNLAVVHPTLMAVSFIEALREHGWNLIDIAEEEFETQASNVLAIEPGQLIMLDGNPITRKRLEFWGCEVETYSGKEISLNRFGGPTCLTRPILRAS